MSKNSGITPLTPAQEALAEQQVKQEGYFRRVLIGADEEGAAILGDKNDETISSWTARLAVNGKGLKGVIGRVVSKGLDLFQKNHGAQAVAGDLERAKMVAKLENESGILPTK